MFYAPLAQHVVYDQPVLALIDHRTHYIGGAVLQLRGSAMGMESLIRKTFSEVDPQFDPHQCPVHAGSGRQHVRSEACASADDWTFWSARACARRRGSLRCHRIHGGATHQRDRSAVGAGADRSNVVRLVLRGAFRQVLIGLAIGIPDFDRMRASDCRAALPGQELGSAGTRWVHRSVGFCALVASVIPAQRAASINPVEALRTE